MPREKTNKKRRLEDGDLQESRPKKARQAAVQQQSPSPNTTRNPIDSASARKQAIPSHEEQGKAPSKKAAAPQQPKKRFLSGKVVPTTERDSEDEQELRSVIVDDGIDMFNGVLSDLEGEEKEIERRERRADQQRQYEERRARRSKAKAERKQDALQRAAENKPQKELRSLAKVAEDAADGVNGDVQQGRWTLSTPMAGRYLDVDPLFVRDDEGNQYLVTATGRSVQLLSLDDSLFVRACPIPEQRTVVNFAASSEQAELVYFALDDGTLHTWAWKEDAPPRHLLTLPGQCKGLAAATDHASGKEHSVSVSEVRSTHVICIDGDMLHTTSHELQSVRVLCGSSYVIAHGSSVIIFGTKSSAQDSESVYTWTELPMSMPITCFDVRPMSAPVPNKKGSSRLPGLSLAIGNCKGQIHLYEDVSSMIATKALPSPRILHWHREAVSSVKFSKDGNYLISGGQETVLVLWQLQTGKKQFLPHLTSVIDRIVVSPAGDRYAVRMGDNSIMVLSTSELKPVANFAGLQLASQSVLQLAAWRTAVLRPHQPNQLLLIVPASQAADDARPFLQTFDMRTSRHFARQALTRNNVTDFNLGPEDTPIVPPDVAHMQISHDGQWLATVDEWMPPASDLDYLAAGSVEILEERERRREVYLKFWRWEEAQNMWLLSTRVDAPHARSGDPLNWAAGRVLQLVTEPRTNGFATLGEDGHVKTWRPKTKTRHGVIMTDANNQDVIEWTCRRIVVLPKHEELADSPMRDQNIAKPSFSVNGSIAYSDDGSILAVAITHDEQNEARASLLHFIDAHQGTIAATKAGMLATTELYALGFLDRYLLIVSHQNVQVWDLIEEKIHHHHFIPIGAAKLAVHPAQGTYAVAVGDKISVYRPNNTQPICKMECESGIATVLAGGGQGNGRGYTILCDDATVRTLLPTGSTSGHRLPAELLPTDEEDMVSVAAIDEVAAAEPMDVEEQVEVRSTSDLLLTETEDDRPVVRPEQLAGVFDVGQSFAMPPVKDMFEAIVGLFGRRPHEREGGEMVAAVS